MRTLILYVIIGAVALGAGVGSWYLTINIMPPLRVEIINKTLDYEELKQRLNLLANIVSRHEYQIDVIAEGMGK